MVSGASRNKPIGSSTRCFPGCVIRRLSVNPVEKGTLKLGILCLTSRSETGKDIVKDNVSAELGIEPGTLSPTPSTPSSMVSFHHTLHPVHHPLWYHFTTCYTQYTILYGITSPHATPSTPSSMVSLHHMLHPTFKKWAVAGAPYEPCLGEVSCCVYYSYL